MAKKGFELDPEQLNFGWNRSYRLVYKIEEGIVVIIAVIHGKRLLGHALDSFSGY